MAKIMEVLKAFCKEIETENQFGLILKGGTALALYRFNHRESEDLDFDVDISFRKDIHKLEEYFKTIFNRLQQNILKVRNIRTIVRTFVYTNVI